MAHLKNPNAKVLQDRRSKANRTATNRLRERTTIYRGGDSCRIATVGPPNKKAAPLRRNAAVRIGRYAARARKPYAASTATGIRIR